MPRRAQVRAAVGAGVVLLLLVSAAWLGRRGEHAPTPRASQAGPATASSPEGPERSDAEGAPTSPEAPGGDASRSATTVEAGEPRAPLTDEALAALAEELAQDPNTHVICDLGIDVRHAEAYLALGGHSDLNGRRVQVVQGKAYLPLVYDLGDLGDAVFDERTGVFSLEGYGPVDIGWTGRTGDGPGRCNAPVTPELGRASLTGTLTLKGSGMPAIGGWIEGCGNLAFADQHGVVHMDIVPEPCIIVAMRQDGLLRTMSDRVSIEPRPGQDVVVDIEIPEAPRGGLGVQISQSDDGLITIDGILDTGPAGRAGLEQGDVVLTVDGDPTADMSLGEFVRRVGGEAGTSVQLVVEREGEEMSFELVREVLSSG